MYLISFNDSRRFVVQNLINLLHNLRRQLFHRSYSSAILIHLLRAAGTGNGRADIGVLKHPRQRKSAHLNFQLIRNGLQLVDLLDDAVPCVLAGAAPVPLDELDAGLGEARVVGDAVLVLAGQDALAHGREDGQAQPRLRVEVGEFALDLFAGQHVVGGLLHDGADEAELIGVAPGGGDLVGVPFGGAPVEGLALVDDVVEGADGLFDGGLTVRSVGVDEVYVVELKTLESGVDTLDNVLSGKALVVDGVVTKGTSPVDLTGQGFLSAVRSSACAGPCGRFAGSQIIASPYLGGDDQVIALPAVLLDSLAHDNLRLTLGVGLSAIEEVDATVVRSFHAAICALYMMSSSRQPASSL